MDFALEVTVAPANNGDTSGANLPFPVIVALSEQARSGWMG